MKKENTSWQNGGLPLLNVAATCRATRALGPGVRAVVWVQGCPLNCRGCVAPEWIPYHVARLVNPKDLANELLTRQDITGLTFSGGEPMLQAAGLAALARYARQQRPHLSLICFTGFGLEYLRNHPPALGVDELLSQIDVLIDGPYVAARNDNRGLRGSTNQRVHYLTKRLHPNEYDFRAKPRQAEIYVENGSLLLVGVPPSGLLTAFESALDEMPKSQ